MWVGWRQMTIANNGRNLPNIWTPTALSKTCKSIKNIYLLLTLNSSFFLRHLRFSQRCHCWFKARAMWRWNVRLQIPLRCVISVVSCNYYLSVYYVHTYNTFSHKTQQKLVLLHVLYYSIKSNDMFRPL
jgi:hypothetical protein